MFCERTLAVIHLFDLHLHSSLDFVLEVMKQRSRVFCMAVTHLFREKCSKHGHVAGCVQISISFRSHRHNACRLEKCFILKIQCETALVHEDYCRASCSVIKTISYSWREQGPYLWIDGGVFLILQIRVSKRMDKARIKLTTVRIPILRTLYPFLAAGGNYPVFGGLNYPQGLQ